MHKADMIAGWLKDDKVECSLELGDLIPDKKMVQAAIPTSMELNILILLLLGRIGVCASGG